MREGGGINQGKIDNAITNWINIVKEAKEGSVPKSKVNNYIHPKVSDYIKLLEQNYKQLISLNNWNREQLIQIRNIQEQLKEESKRLSTEIYLSIYLGHFPQFGGGSRQHKRTTKTMRTPLRSSSNDEGPSRVWMALQKCGTIKFKKYIHSIKMQPNFGIILNY